MRVGRYFIVGLLILGVLVGFAISRIPQLQLLPVPAFTVPLIISFLVELALLPFVRDERIEPLTMGERAFGVIGAALIATGIQELSK